MGKPGSEETRYRPTIAGPRRPPRRWFSRREIDRRLASIDVRIFGTSGLTRPLRTGRVRARLPGLGSTLLGIAFVVSSLGIRFAVATSPPPLAIPPPSTITTLKPSQIRPSARPSSIDPTTPMGFVNNTRVNQNAGSLSRPQAEPAAASEPQNRQIMVSGFSDYVSDVEPGVARSTDGGTSWTAPTGGAILPNPPGFQWGSRSTVGYLAGGDPSVAWSTGSTVYYSTLGFQDFTNPPTPNTCNVGGLYVYESTDAGNTWTLPANGPAIANTQTVFRDKEYIAADSNPLSAHAGTLYLAWSDDHYSSCPQDFSTNFVSRSIMFSRSTDGGTTWSTPAELASGCLEAAIPAVGADGSVYVVWWDCNSGNRQMIRKSTDGGMTWGTAVVVASGFTGCPNPLTGSSFRVNGLFPSIATDPTNAGDVYIVYPACPGGTYSDVFIARSTDGGSSWSLPLRVNDDPTTDQRDQFMPWIAVADDGTVRVMWGDDRLDTVNPGGKYYDIFMAESSNRGSSFGANIRVTDQSSNPDNDGFGGTFIGDYFGMASCGTPVWTDTRNGNDDIFAAARDANSDGLADGCAGGTPPSADLSITKTDGVTTVTAGASSGSYTITVHNAGPSDATGVALADSWPPGFTRGTVSLSQGTCTDVGSGPDFTCALGTIASGASATVTVDYSVPASATGDQTNTASASSGVSDPDSTNNSASDTDHVAVTGIDGAMNVIVNGPTKSVASGGSGKVFVTKACNEGTVDVTVDPRADIATSRTVNGDPAGGTVTLLTDPTPPFLRPGRCQRYRWEWSYGGDGPANSGDTVVYQATWNLAGDIFFANNSDSETRTAT